MKELHLILLRPPELIENKEGFDGVDDAPDAERPACRCDLGGVLVRDFPDFVWGEHASAGRAVGIGPGHVETER